jgi:CRISPR-associated exonuclease Cas4
MFPDDDLIPLSALRHYAVCPRQCALVHIEQQWAENLFTAEGRVLHERAHSGEVEFRDGVVIARAVRLCSREVGLSGVADVVEFHPLPGPPGARLPGRAGLWQPFPVEYKRGRPKADPCDEIQLCAQAVCLEEMLRVPVPRGALFYGQPRRRTEVEFHAALRAATAETATAVHELIRACVTPPPPHGAPCRHCSLIDLCQPEAGAGRKVLPWVEARVRDPV